jgi:CHAT domain-containing protein
VQIDDIQDLPSLPDTAAELRDIAVTLKAPIDSVVLGAEATKANLLSYDLAQYRVLAFSTHGLLANQLECARTSRLWCSAYRRDRRAAARRC